jgi:hypothetical protein
LSDTDPYEYLPDGSIDKVEYINVEHNNNFNDSMMYKFTGIDIAYSDGYEKIYYIDADTKIVNSFSLSDIFSEFMTIYHVLNDFDQINYEKLTFEKNKNCMAYFDINTLKTPIYYHARFFSGTKENMNLLCKTINNWHRIDKKNNITPVWNDESYFNKFLNVIFDKKITTIKYDNNILLEDQGIDSGHIEGKLKTPMGEYDMDILKEDIKFIKDKPFEIRNGRAFTITI